MISFASANKEKEGMAKEKKVSIRSEIIACSERRYTNLQFLVSGLPITAQTCHLQNKYAPPPQVLTCDHHLKEQQ